MFVAGRQVHKMVEYMLSMCDSPQTLLSAMKGLGQLSNIVLHRFEPFLEDAAAVALIALQSSDEPQKSVTTV
jgi:hypothetical protein